MILSMVNVKGGVGKTTTAVNLSAAFAGEGGLRTLLVDLDPQGSATFSLGIGQDDADPSAADLLLGNLPVEDVIRRDRRRGPRSRRRLDDLGRGRFGAGAQATASPSTGPLSGSCSTTLRHGDHRLPTRPGRAFAQWSGGVPRLRRAGGAARPRYGGSEPLSLARSKAVKGLARKPSLLGILLTMVDRRTRVTDEVVAGIREAYGRRVFGTEIPINVRLAEAPGYGKTIFEHEGWSAGAQAYRLLGGEILKRARRDGLI